MPEVDVRAGEGRESRPFDMITMPGFLILLGTPVSNPILIADQATRTRCAMSFEINSRGFHEPLDHKGFA